MAPPAPWLLWTLLLLAPTLSSQQEVWDRPTCTEGVVTVHRGQWALMSCNSSSPFTHINIHLKAPGKAAQLIFRVDAPGTFSSAGWRLVVQGGKAQLVIQDAQPGQAGVYMWNFVGRQRNMKYTQLEVSGAPDEVPTVTIHQDLPPLPPCVFPEPPDPTHGRIMPLIILLGIIPSLLVLLILAWHRRLSPQLLPQCLQDALGGYGPG